MVVGDDVAVGGKDDAAARAGGNILLEEVAGGQGFGGDLHHGGGDVGHHVGHRQPAGAGSGAGQGAAALSGDSLVEHRGTAAHVTGGRPSSAKAGAHRKDHARRHQQGCAGAAAAVGALGLPGGLGGRLLRGGAALEEVLELAGDLIVTVAGAAAGGLPAGRGGAIFAAVPLNVLVVLIVLIVFSHLKNLPYLRRRDPALFPKALLFCSVLIIPQECDGRLKKNVRSYEQLLKKLYLTREQTVNRRFSSF